MTQIVQLPKGTQGFDINEVVNAEAARVFFASGLRFATRYVPRIVRSRNDLTIDEVGVLHKSGLAVMAVQHVESESSWIPNVEKGAMYGLGAAIAARECGLLQGTHVWCDLEGVDPSVIHEDIIAYCNAWYDTVEARGYRAGLYVGWHNGLTSKQLYKSLRFKAYWAAYNLNADQYPITRGCMMLQHLSKSVADLDLVTGDNLWGFPLASAPDGWSAT